MYKTNKWIPIIILFLILLLCALLLFTMLGQQANAGNGDGGASSSSHTPSTPPTSASVSDSSMQPSDSASENPTEPPASSSATQQPTDSTSTTQTPSDSTSASATSSSSDSTSSAPPPTIDLSAKFPLYNAAGAKIADITIEEYLCGALLGAISFTYSPSALAAQAIALRTDVYARIAAGELLSTETYGYADHATLLPVWGTDFADTIWARICDAVAETSGQVLLQDGELYPFNIVGEHGVLLAETDIGRQAKTKNVRELLAFYYPSATVLEEI